MAIFDTISGPANSISDTLIRWWILSAFRHCSRQRHNWCLLDNAEVCLCLESCLVFIGNWKLSTGEKWVPDCCTYFQIESYSLKNCIGCWVDREFTMIVWLTGLVLWWRKIILSGWGAYSSPISWQVIDVWGQAEDVAASFFSLEATEWHFKVNQQNKGCFDRVGRLTPWAAQAGRSHLKTWR